MPADLFAALYAADPSALPLWAVVFFSAGMYPLGLMLGSNCCDRCTRVGCFLDPRGYWEHNSYDDELGYPLGKETSIRCRKACSNTEVYRAPTFVVEGGRDVTRPVPGPECSAFLDGAVPDWGGLFHCTSTSTATQIAVTLSGAVAATAPAGDALETEIQDANDAFQAAINTTIVFDLDCEGYGGCMPLAEPLEMISVENFFGNRVVKKRQVQPVATASVQMRKIDGVDASGLFFQVMLLSEIFYYKNTTPGGTVVEEHDLALLDEVVQHDFESAAFAGLGATSNLAQTSPGSGAFGCSKRPSVGRTFDGVPPYSLNWEFDQALFHFGVSLTVSPPDDPVPEDISTDGCFGEPAGCTGKTFTQEEYDTPDYVGPGATLGLLSQTVTLGPFLDASSVISWEAALL